MVAGIIFADNAILKNALNHVVNGFITNIYRKNA
jgi:hypothetical protein